MLNRDRLAGAVRAKRGKRSMRDVAKDIGVSYFIIWRAEHREVVGLDPLLKLCAWLDLPVDYFINQPPVGATLPEVS